MSKEILYYDFEGGFRHEIEVLSLEALPDANKARITYPHRANFYIVIWFTGGPYEHHIDFTPVAIPKGSFLLVDKEQVHSFDKKNEVKGKLILFTDRFFYKDAASMGLLNSFSLFNDFLAPAVIPLNDRSAHLSGYFEKV